QENIAPCRLCTRIHLTAAPLPRMDPDNGTIVYGGKGIAVRMAIHNNDFPTDPSLYRSEVPDDLIDRFPFLISRDNRRDYRPHR
ncbi:MAG TPA: hypothetical protein PK022_08855, partial [Syntrophales bacterium]|nr:hypothetical protein [Syntrophales bacterium]